MKLRTFFGVVLPTFLLAPDMAQAQTGPQPADPAQQERILKELQDLRAMRQEMQRRMGEFNARIQSLEKELGAAPAQSAAASGPQKAGGAPAQPPAVVPVQTAQQESGSPPKKTGTFYEPGRGFVLVQDDEGELGAGVFSYVRYLNQRALDGSYTDSFGRDLPLSDIRNDIQIQKVSWNFKGWLFDPNFRYYYFFWTSNSQMGEGAQVVIGGYFQYRFSDFLTVTAGVMPLPTTRSTNYTFPNWLRNDNRIMADEFFRGSYTTGIDALGEIAPGLRYRVALGNNLAQLGVSSQELDAKFNTLSGTIWWMPTTGEFGPASGFGDYEYHKDLATLVGAHYTRSREDAQGQPDVDDFENSQIRLSDGTLIFSPDPFGTGGKIERATYQMVALNAGLKYRGWYFEGEYYFRWVDNFKTTGFIPVDDLFDHGFSVQGAAMIVQKTLQAYATGSKIFGEYGDPWELAIGLNYFPFKRKEMRMNLQGLLLNRSPVGGSSLPSVVGGDGWVLSTDVIVAF